MEYREVGKGGVHGIKIVGNIVSMVFDWSKSMNICVHPRSEILEQVLCICIINVNYVQ